MEFQGHIFCPKLMAKKVFVQHKIDAFDYFFQILDICQIRKPE